MEERRKNDRRTLACQPQNPLCMTIGFMFGMIVGSLIHNENSLVSVVVSVGLATVVFHYTFVKNISFSQLIGFFKKGS